MFMKFRRNTMAADVCYICGSNATIEHNGQLTECDCPVCGKYVFKYFDLDNFDLNHLGAYLAYNGHKNNNKCFATMDKGICDDYKNRFDLGVIKFGHPIRLEPDDVENWYPKTFTEKVDYILLYLNSKIQHIGQSVDLLYEELFSTFFIDRYDFQGKKYESRNKKLLKPELDYMLDYLEKQQLILSERSIKIKSNSNTSLPLDYKYIGSSCALTPNAYNRIDTLQKNNVNGNNVLVAMKFGEDTNQLREAIRKGVTAAGYKAIFIDEVEHNDFITPELLKYIKDSKFVVVDLSHQNNGAYFEEGYAMGLGKPVIQLCQKDVTLHFDIAQKNTIIWETEDEIPKRLKNRIKATID